MDPIALKTRLLNLRGFDVDRVVGSLSYDLQHNPGLSLATAVERAFESLDYAAALEAKRDAAASSPDR